MDAPPHCKTEVYKRTFGTVLGNRKAGKADEEYCSFRATNKAVGKIRYYTSRSESTCKLKSCPSKNKQ